MPASAVTAATVVVLRSERVLLVRQPAEPAWWGLPGGKLRRGEPAVAAAARELAEETGLRAGAESLVALGEPFDGAGGARVQPFALPEVAGAVPGGELASAWVSLARPGRRRLLPGVGRSVHAAVRLRGRAERAGGGAARALLAWWERERRELPWRRTRDPYALLVCEVMSQQTQIERVVPRWERWMARWPTAASLAEASLAEVLREWDGLGYPRRARDLHAAARAIAARGWPASDRLSNLPGVGPYTAAALRCFAWEQPVLPRDAATARVLARRFPAGLDSEGEAWRLGQAVMELGQRVCARRPRCERCPLRAGCLVALQEFEGGAAAAGGEPGPSSVLDFDPAPGARRQAPYTGSLRERRGRLLRAVLAGERPPLARDPPVARSLLADGLVGCEGTRLVPPAVG
jgi:A/G-specific adenine glycosylase